MKKLGDAIQTDVSTENVDKDKTDLEPVLSDRDVALQEIHSQIDEQTLENTVIEQETEEVVAEILPEVLADDQLDKLKVNVKIDGEVVAMSLSEVTKGYQKDAVGSRKLELAAEERKGLDQLRDQLAERERVLNATPTLSKEETDAPDNVDEQIRVAMSAIVDGDEETATEALKGLLGNQQKPGQVIDEDALTEKVTQQVELKQEEKVRVEAEKKDWDSFVVDNPNFADVDGKQRQYGDFLFINKYQPQLEAGEISYREALDKTAEEVAGMFVEKPPEEAKTELQKREERKDLIDNLPTANSRAVKTAVVDESPEDVLAEMAAGRGQ